MHHNGAVDLAVFTVMERKMMNACHQIAQLHRVGDGKDRK
jgi:hypothetical protein